MLYGVHVKNSSGKGYIVVAKQEEIATRALRYLEENKYCINNLFYEYTSKTELKNTIPCILDNLECNKLDLNINDFVCFDNAMSDLLYDEFFTIGKYSLTKIINNKPVIIAERDTLMEGINIF